MPFPFGPSRKSVERIGGWLGKYAKERLADMRAPSDLPRALMNPDAPGSREQLMAQAFAMVASIGPSGRAGKAVAKKVSSAARNRNLAETGFAKRPTQSVVLPTTSAAGKVGTVEAVAAARRAVGDVEFRRQAAENLASRGGRASIHTEKAAVEETARRIYDQQITGQGAKKMLRVEHYSAKPGLRTLDPKFAGTGRAGREVRRTDRPPATHLYSPKAGRVEQEFAKDYRYTAEIPEERIYDVSDDAAGIVSRLSKKGTAPVDGSRLERAIQKEGYMGYRSSFDAPETLKIFEKLDVTAAAPRKIGGQTFGVSHPEPSVGSLAKQLLSIIQNNRAGFSVRLGQGGLVPATTGYAVGAGGVQKNALTVPLDKLNLKQLTSWMKANPAAWRKGLLGGWVDDAGNAVIEPSTPVASLARATKLGEKRGEKAIGDLAKYARGEDGTISLRAAADLRTTGVELGERFAPARLSDDADLLAEFTKRLGRPLKRGETVNRVADPATGEPAFVLHGDGAEWNTLKTAQELRSAP